MKYQVNARDETTNDPILLQEFDDRKEDEKFALGKTFEGTRACVERII